MAKTNHPAYRTTPLKVSVSAVERGDKVAFNVDIRSHTNRVCAADTEADVIECVNAAIQEWATENEKRLESMTGSEIMGADPLEL